MKLYDKPAHVLHDMLREKKISAVELTKDVLERLEAVEDEVGAYLTVTREAALEQAEAVDKKIAGGEELSFFTGIPGALKDNICTQGVKTTCASKILENFVPPYNATVTQKLREVDAPLLGKTNLDEFAMGGSTENSAFHPTRNPWKTTHQGGKDTWLGL
ncbi:MAG: amidase, partial [Negativicutes bacterium]